MKNYSFMMRKASSLYRSQGYVLATSLLLLIVMASLAVSMYGNVTVQEKMASNSRLKSHTLVAVKSAVQENWSYKVLRDEMVSTGTTENIQITDEYDEGSVDLQGEVVVCYLGEGECFGCSMDAGKTTDASGFANKAFYMAGHIEEPITKTSTTIEQAGVLLLSNSNHESTCSQAQLDAAGTAISSTSISVPTIELQPSLY